MLSFHGELYSLVEVSCPCRCLLLIGVFSLARSLAQNFLDYICCGLNSYFAACQVRSVIFCQDSDLCLVKRNPLLLAVILP